MAFILKFQYFILLVTVISIVFSVESATTPDLTCLSDIEKIIQNANAQRKTDLENNGASGNLISDGPFEFSLPGVIEVSGSLAGVKLQGARQKIIEDLKFNSATFELSFKLQEEKDRIDGEKYSIKGSIGRFNVNGSGENFYIDTSPFSAEIRVLFESNGFDCTKGKYQVKDLVIDLKVEGPVKISIPGLIVNEKLVDWEKVNAILAYPGEHWNKSKDVVIKYMINSLNQILKEFVVPPAIIQMILPEMLKRLP